MIAFVSLNASIECPLRKKFSNLCKDVFPLIHFSVKQPKSKIESNRHAAILSCMPYLSIFSKNVYCFLWYIRDKI